MNRPQAIILDYGHGGMVQGRYQTAGKAFTFAGGLEAREGAINREVAAALVKCLLGRVEVWDALAGCQIVEPPLGGADLVQEDVDLVNRVVTANRLPPRDTVLVSIHADAEREDRLTPYRGGSARGLSVWTSPGTTVADRVATDIHTSCRARLPRLGLPVRRGDLWDHDPDYEADFYVLRHTRCPAVLVECGFFTNRLDAEILLSSGGQEVIARAIAEGLVP